jgi:DNA-binding transcriptional LysR family regulator
LRLSEDGRSLAETVGPAMARIEMGVVVIDPRLIEQEVAAGQLIVPFGPPLALETGYWLVWRRGPGTTRPLTAFRTWLAEELAGTERSADPVK